MLLPPKRQDDDGEDDDGPKVVPWWRRTKVLLLCGLLIFVLWLMFHGGKPADKSAEMTAGKQTAIAQEEPYVAPPAPPEPKPEPPPARQSAPSPQPPPPPRTVVSIPRPPAPPVVPQSPAGLPIQSGPQQRYAAMSSYSVPKAPKIEALAAPDQTGFKFETAKIQVDKASPAMDETYLLQPGLLPVVLETAIDSSLPGPLFGHVLGNIYSNAGVLLVENGSRVEGHYESMKNNTSARLFAVATTIHTPRGVWMKIPEEQLGDDLGRVGLDGSVDNHYLQRFGAAIALNITDALLGVLQAEVSKGGNTYLQLNTGSGTGGLAQQILQQTINIPPTFTKNQGSVIEILISRPIDFSDSYRIRKEPNNGRNVARAASGRDDATLADRADAGPSR